MTAALTFAHLAATNLQRCKRWHPGFPADGWTGADWGNAAAGEMGEACNVVKKLRRGEAAMPGANDPGRDKLIEQLGQELADTVIYLDLLAQHYGIDLAEAVVAKFNAVSVREGFPERLDPVPDSMVSASRRLMDLLDLPAMARVVLVDDAVRIRNRAVEEVAGRLDDVTAQLNALVDVAYEVVGRAADEGSPAYVAALLRGYLRAHHPRDEASPEYEHDFGPAGS